MTTPRIACLASQKLHLWDGTKATDAKLPVHITAVFRGRGGEGQGRGGAHSVISLAANMIFAQRMKMGKILVENNFVRKLKLIGVMAFGFASLVSA